MPEFTGRWTGRVRPQAEAEHRAFLASLASAQGADLLRRIGLQRYALYQEGLELEVHFTAPKPSLLAGFLRNKRMWPEYWEFSQPGQADAAPTKPLVFEWVPDSEALR